MASNGTQGNTWAGPLSISTNGRFVAFQSRSSSDLVSGDTNDQVDIFVRDRLTQNAAY
ncbi:MAG: hypothetical protein V3W04_05915 [Gammaproteobacteria bacterium]